MMYYVGFCPSCEQGVLGVRVCAGEGHPVVLCDECDATWLSTNLDSPPQFLAQPDLPCPVCQQSLRNSPAHWATFDEIVASGLLGRITGRTGPSQPEA